MAQGQVSPYRKRFNTEIISKTEIALEAIRRHDMDQSRSTFLNYQPSSEKTLLSDLDKDYSMLTASKKVLVDRVYKINLMPHSQQFYSFDIANHVFPIRILLKNVRSEGFFYAGYDHEYPGVINKSKKEGKEKQTEEENKNYDYKIAFNKDILITLKNKSNKSVNNIFFTLIAASDLLMFHMKLETLGLSKEVRFSSQVKLTRAFIDNKSTNKQQTPKLLRQKTEPIQVFKSLTKSKFPQISRSIQKPVMMEEFKVFNEQMVKNGSKLQLSPKKSVKSVQKNMTQGGLNLMNSFSSQYIIRQGKTESGNHHDKSDINLRLQQIKKNRSVLQTCKQKDKQLRETASKCKKLINEYKKIYNQENVRKCKLNRNLVLIVYSLLFVSRKNQQYKIRNKRAQSLFKITYLCKKLIKNLKKKHEQIYKMMPYRLKRYNFQASSSMCLESRLIYKQSTNMASNVILQTFFFLKPILSINRALNTANTYRNKLKLIQRVWKSKYHSRIYSLHYFVDNHVQKMVKQYPHLKLFLDNFYKTKAYHQIALNYIKDESEKYRFIYEAYLRKLQEIEQMVLVNKKLMQQGSKKQKLTIPKRPLRPMHRFFRNCDILKSMVRSWFEIEYKKYFKKSFPKYTK